MTNMKKIMTFALTNILLLATLIFLSDAGICEDSNSYNLYVDDDFDNTTIGWGIDHFDNLQNAIDAASEGDTIYVYNGTYYNDVSGYTAEQFTMRAIVINKSINLIGASNDNTFLDGGKYGSIFRITADWVSISGFTIQNSRNILDIIDVPLDPGIGISINSNHTNISDNIIMKNTNGMSIEGSYNTITSNTIIDNGDGIILSGSHNTIKHNTITNHERDLTVLGSSFNDGIILEGAIENIITNNVISNNNGIGIDISIYGVSKNNTFYHNNFINNSQNARYYHNSTWDNGSSGNYWDDYNGLDKNNDGIGDTPYDIPGGDTKDYFPLMTPYDGTIRIKEFYVDDEALYTMLIIGMIAAILFCLPIAYVWYRKYYKIK